MPKTAVNFEKTLSVNAKNAGIECFSDIDFFEDAIITLLNRDQKLKKPVVISINGKALSLLAKIISGGQKSPVSVGIAGYTASGKSTFVKDILTTAENLQMENRLTLLYADNYYYDRSKEVIKAGGIAKFAETYDLDRPEAIELSLLKTHIACLLKGEEVKTPKYFMCGSAVRHDDYYSAESSPVIISEGLFNLNKEIQDIFDIKIFVDTTEKVRKKRWFERAEQRGFKGEQAKKMYKTVSQKGELYIKPSISNADIIINGEADRTECGKFFLSLYNIYADKLRKQAFI